MLDSWEEVIIVKDIIRWWVENKKLKKLPFVAMGLSSRGYFVSMLATVLKFTSITIMIAEGKFNKMDIKSYPPPTLVVHMPKDILRKQKVDEYMEVLTNDGLDVAEIDCKEFPLSPQLIKPHVLISLLQLSY